MKYYCDNTLLYTFTPASFPMSDSNIISDTIIFTSNTSFILAAIPTSIMDENTAMYNAVADLHTKVTPPPQQDQILSF